MLGVLAKRKDIIIFTHVPHDPSIIDSTDPGNRQKDNFHNHILGIDKKIVLWLIFLYELNWGSMKKTE